MAPEKKRKLRNIALLALLGLIGGTFAFQAFNQQAINDRLRENPVTEAAGRVHDYFNRETENKDVFVENYGQQPIMVRIKLSEFMEIQERGQTGWRQVTSGQRNDVSSWETYYPRRADISHRRYVHLNPYSQLTFGQEGGRQWYLPTFNHAVNDPRTAAAGDAENFYVGGLDYHGNETFVENREATHPGDGTDGYWERNESYDNTNGRWFGSQVIRNRARNLQEERPPMTLWQWRTWVHDENLEPQERFGNFWVMDEETGWAYWANQLQGGQTTSYLIDKAEMLEAADEIPGSYYYGIHVESNLISPDERFEREPEIGYADSLGMLLDSIRNYGDGNPSPGTNLPIGAFDLKHMNPGRLFTTSGQ